VAQRQASSLIGLDLRPELQVTPAVVRLAALLALPAGPLDDAVDQAVAENPILVRQDAPTCPGCGRPSRALRCPYCTSTSVQVDPADLPDQADPRSDLLAELRRLLPTGDHSAAELVVADLDVHGLLGRPAETAAAELGLPITTVRRVLAALSAAGPPGLGAATLADALTDQLDAHLGPVPPLARRIIRDHLDALAAAGASAVAADLGVPSAELATALRWIRTELHAPSLPLRRPEPAIRPPDIVVSLNRDGDLVVQVATALDGIGLDEEWLRLAAGGGMDPAARMEIQARVAAARMFLALLAERAGALHKVAQTVVAAQREAVIRGDEYLRDLTRHEVARSIGVHPSTVSRAVSDKTLLRPDRTLRPLASYFGVGLAARACLRDVLTARGPLPDAAAAAELARRGHPVARRTVAKYRAELGIPAAGAGG
jgi:RNA polymerase sigma-54 factor